MQIHKLILTFFIISLSWLGVNAYASASAPQNDPVGLLQYIADNMIVGLKNNKATLKTKPQIVYRLADHFIVPYTDVTQMAKGVLPPSIWNKATAAQREQFKKAFTTTLIRTYASALSSYEDQTVRFYPIRGGYEGKAAVDVQSDIQGSQGDPISVSYRMIRLGNAWKLYDLSVGGLDMLESFRSQFADILANGTMDQLLQRMSTHNQGA